MTSTRRVATPEHGDRLDELLFRGDRQLVNFKLLPGVSPHTSPKAVRDAAAHMIESALEDPHHAPPDSGQEQTTLEDFVP